MKALSFWSPTMMPRKKLKNQPRRIYLVPAIHRAIDAARRIFNDGGDRVISPTGASYSRYAN